MTFERSATKQQLRIGGRQQGINVRQHFFVGPGQDRSQRKVVKFASRRELGQLRQQRFFPVLVHENYALRRTLLTGGTVCVLI